MADSFTFSDRVQAVLANCACLTCFGTSSSNDHLSADEADTLSLHSNLTSSQRGPHPKGKHIKLFGWDIFGRRSSGIRLPDSDGEEDDQVTLFGKKKTRSRQRGEWEPSAESTSTFDSDADASPLDASLIDARAAEEVERRQKELEKAERRRLRLERKELKRMAMVGSFQDSGEFEGFPGSGSGINEAPSSTHASRSGPLRPADHEDDDADLDGGAYSGQTSNRGDSRSNSDSRSRTTTSASRSTDGAQYASYTHQHQITAHHSRSITSPRASLSNKRPKRLSKSIHSSSSASASVSLPSPVPADDHSFQPFIHGRDHHNEDDDYESRFPSVGFTGTPRMERKGSLRDQGGMLAHSGF